MGQDFPYFSNQGNFLPNSTNFTEGPNGFANLINPFTITDTSEWTVSEVWVRCQLKVNWETIDECFRLIPRNTRFSDHGQGINKELYSSL